MKWAGSLIRIANHEVETLQKRLGEIVERRERAEMKLAALHAEAEAEQTRAMNDIETGWCHLGFAQGWRLRRDAAQSAIDVCLDEETGARDALSRAFEELKKFEHVAEIARLDRARDDRRRDTAALDEMGLRAANGR